MGGGPWVHELFSLGGPWVAGRFLGAFGSMFFLVRSLDSLIGSLIDSLIGSLVGPLVDSLIDLVLGSLVVSLICLLLDSLVVSLIDLVIGPAVGSLIGSCINQWGSLGTWVFPGGTRGSM